MQYATRDDRSVEPDVLQAEQKPTLVERSARFNLTPAAATLATIGIISAITWAVFRSRTEWTPAIFAFVLIGPLASILAFAISAFASEWRVPCAARKWLVPFTVSAVCASGWAAFGFVTRILERG